MDVILQKSFDLTWDDLTDKAQQALADHIGIDKDDIPYRTDFEEGMATVFIGIADIHAEDLDKAEKFNKAWKIDASDGIEEI